VKSETISQAFKEAIGERTVVRAFFSTYCFEPDFFELDVIPLLLGGAALSTDDSIRYHQLQLLMTGDRDRFAVVYDMDVFAPTSNTRLEVDYLPVRVNGACQHSKIAVLEVQSGEDEPAIILAAGSFNLTKAGWWTNIEVGHWVEVSREKAPRNIVEPLAKALTFFQRVRPVPVLAALAARLAEWKIHPEDDACTFYFSGAGPDRIDFSNFLKPVSSGSIDIVSPFFAEQGDNFAVTAFLNRFDKVSLLLPTDDRGTATITRAVYDGLSHNVSWCRWHDKVRSSYELHADGIRKLHAKIYAGKSWRFIGSVNLSQKALRENIEAGFLLQKTKQLKLFSEMPEHGAFAPAAATEAPAQQGEIAMPPLSLLYDWQNDVLEVTNPSTGTGTGTLTVFDQQGSATGNYLLETDTTQAIHIGSLAAQLERSSLLDAIWTAPDGRCSGRRTLLVSQRHVYCRPSKLPPLTVQELLRLFQDMALEARLAVVTTIAARKAHLDGLTSSEFLPAAPPDMVPASFFSEFSEVNGAFWSLRKKLEAAQGGELDYYLDGKQHDSLSGFAKALHGTDGSAAVSPIARYLTLLSMAEILVLWQREDTELAHEVQNLITATEDSEAFNALSNKIEFLKWIKEKFSMPVRRLHNAAIEREREQVNG
jgi:hypothetical protein